MCDRFVSIFFISLFLFLSNSQRINGINCNVHKMSTSVAMSEWGTRKFSSHIFLRTDIVYHRASCCISHLPTNQNYTCTYMNCTQYKEVSSAKSTRKWQTIFENVEGLKVLGLPYLHSEIWSDKCHAKRMYSNIHTYFV